MQRISVYHISDVEAAVARNNRRNDIAIRSIENELTTAQKQITDERKLLDTYTEQHEQYVSKMHKSIADFLYTYENRKHLRKHIPAH